MRDRNSVSKRPNEVWKMVECPTSGLGAKGVLLFPRLSTKLIMGPRMGSGRWFPSPMVACSVWTAPARPLLSQNLQRTTPSICLLAKSRIDKTLQAEPHRDLVYRCCYAGCVSCRSRNTADGCSFMKHIKPVIPPQGAGNQLWGTDQIQYRRK